LTECAAHVICASPERESFMHVAVRKPWLMPADFIGTQCHAAAATRGFP
jgi:hypothetical protein